MPEARGANHRHAAHDGSLGGRAGGGWKAGGADCADAAKQAGGGIHGRRGGGEIPHAGLFADPEGHESVFDAVGRAG